MTLTPEICELLRLTRDARFDGRFFIGVTSTGVYCRPICPVPPPLEKNVRYFPSAAAAAEAGFRPCLRCRPESAPGTPAWNGTSSTVTRALRLIAQGMLDQAGVDRLAEALGVSARHLRRLFDQHLGAAPLAVAQTRRLHFAKKLLDETDLPMTEVALSSGFGSIRRFNAAFQSSYGRSPRSLRRAAPPKREPGADSVRLLLGYRPPFDWNALIDFLAARAIPGVEHVDRAAYRRTITLDGKSGRLQVRPARRNQLELRVEFPDSRPLIRIVERVRGLFDLGADPHQIDRHLALDPLLAPLVRARPGLRVPGAWDGFELAVRAILGQQITVSGATTLAGRLARSFGERLATTSRETAAILFPTPAALARAPIASIGIPEQRAKTVRRLAELVAEGRLGFQNVLDPEAWMAALAKLPGIGDWTAQYVAMRALGEPDAFPASDLGLLRAVATGRSSINPNQLRQLAEPWRPWRAYAAMHLWAAGGSLTARKPRSKSAATGTREGMEKR